MAHGVDRVHEVGSHYEGNRLPFVPKSAKKITSEYMDDCKDSM